MMKFVTVCFFLSLALSWGQEIGDAVNAKAFVNKRAKRTIDASKQIVYVKSDVVIDIIEPGNNYAITVPLVDVPHLSSIQVKYSEGSQAQIPLITEYKSDDFVYYVYDFGDVIGDQVNVTISQYFTDILIPFPSAIRQGELQFVRANLPVYYTSPYETKRQSTSIRVARASRRRSNFFESYSQSPGPVYVEESGRIIRYGPYDDIPGYTATRVDLHYLLPQGFLTATYLEREVELSLWGNIAVEEHLDVLNTGATLVGGFSRVDYLLSQGVDENIVEHIRVMLPRDAAGVYYRDIIGNISTSHFHHTVDSSILDIQPRFPLFGGWKTEWYQGYSVSPAKSQYWTVSDNGVHTLEFPALPGINHLHVRKLKHKIILPEGATVLSVEATFEHSPSESRRFTYLDGFIGRPVVILDADNLVTEVPESFRITFTVPPFAQWYKAIYCVAGFALLFLFFSIVSRLDFSIGKKKSD